MANMLLVLFAVVCALSHVSDGAGIPLGVATECSGVNAAGTPDADVAMCSGTAEKNLACSAEKKCVCAAGFYSKDGSDGTGCEGTQVGEGVTCESVEHCEAEFHCMRDATAIFDKTKWTCKKSGAAVITTSFAMLAMACLVTLGISG